MVMRFLAMLVPVFEPSGAGVRCDLIVWPLLLGGLVLILVLGVVLVVLIIAAVKWLKRLNSN
jgi:hypothetical protein